MVSRAGWVGAPLAIGPHHCPQCGETGHAGDLPGVIKQRWGAAMAEHHWACVIRLYGDIDQSATAELRTVLTDALNRHHNVVLDLSSVRLMDSTGYAELVHVHELSGRRGGQVCLVRPSYPVHAVLRVSRLESLFRIFSDTTAARTGLSACSSHAAEG
ncbi:STAS domain-containing protein [Actinoplanes sp. NPDC024001]|uniref:STAS domain-containing protein n=1 Tax=Actinoplanes sp. NPDC024001 TaxID=3154598 RepID=UPI0033CB2726